MCVLILVRYAQQPGWFSSLNRVTHIDLSCVDKVQDTNQTIDQSINRAKCGWPYVK